MHLSPHYTEYIEGKKPYIHLYLWNLLQCLYPEGPQEMGENEQMSKLNLKVII